MDKKSLNQLAIICFSAFVIIFYLSDSIPTLEETYKGILLIIGFSAPLLIWIIPMVIFLKIFDKFRNNKNK